MEVIIPDLSGFCPGVKAAERSIYKLKSRCPGSLLIVYGYLINNRKYISYLEEQGVHTVNDMESIPAGATAIIRTHGLDRNEEALLRERFSVIDLTCPKVKKVQHEIDVHAQAGYAVVIVGTEDHPETRGHKSYAGECLIIGRIEDGDSILERLRPQGPADRPRKVFLCAQTTASRDLFEAIVSRFKAAGSRSFDLSVYDSICPVTDRKEKESLRLQKQVDVTFVVGDKISANATELFRILSQDPACPAYFIEDVVELRKLSPAPKPDGRALLVSSASTPGFIETEIVAYLRGL
jgi:4-hydroxy-3-methylbut-2-enyl diphosphate reductase